MIVTHLDVPPLPCVSPAGVFDAWSWCPSDVIEWRRAGDLKIGARIGGENPPGLAFVLRGTPGRDPAPFLPRELARLHVFGHGLDEEQALAPWAIDDATDLLHEHRLRPADVFWLAADTLEALVWGLHDWAHFHNHGPFERPAATELQCDLVALAWLRRNAARVGVGPADLERVARDLAALSRRRFEDERIPPPVTDLAALFLGPYPTATLGGVAGA